MIAQLRVASILYLGVVLPMRWLVGNTHKLAKYGWGERSMGRAITLLHDAFVEIQSDGSLLLEQNFMMNIFLHTLQRDSTPQTIPQLSF
jgi:hypothetical protein